MIRFWPFDQDTELIWICTKAGVGTAWAEAGPAMIDNAATARSALRIIASS